MATANTGRKTSGLPATGDNDKANDAEKPVPQEVLGIPAYHM